MSGLTASGNRTGGRRRMPRCSSSDGSPTRCRWARSSRPPAPLPAHRRAGRAGAGRGGARTRRRDGRRLPRPARGRRAGREAGGGRDRARDGRAPARGPSGRERDLRRRVRVGARPAGAAAWQGRHRDLRHPAGPAAAGAATALRGGGRGRGARARASCSTPTASPRRCLTTSSALPPGGKPGRRSTSRRPVSGGISLGGNARMRLAQALVPADDPPLAGAEPV